MATRRAPATSTPKPATKAAAKPAVKPATPAPRKAASKTSAKPASPARKPAAPVKAAAPKAAPESAAKSASKTSAKSSAKTSAQAKAKPVAEKARKPKLVRDSFTMPKVEYAAIDALKDRAAKAGRPAKKSELLRAGIQLLEGLAPAALVTALNALPAIKTGRPAKA